MAIVVAHFDEDLDYFETTAAATLATKYQVHVITSTRRASTLRDGGLKALHSYPAGTQAVGNLSIHRLRPVVAQGQRVIGRGIGRLLKAIGPDLIIQEAPSQFFAVPATRFAKRSRTPLVYLSGENSQQGPQTGWRKAAKEVYWNTVVRAVINYTTDAAAMVVATTPETRRVLLKANRACDPVVVPLPYRSDKFFYDEELRLRSRSPWADPDDHVTLFIGRFDPTKDLFGIIEGWEAFARERTGTKLVLAGFTGDAFSRSVAQRCASSTLREGIQVRPFLPADEVNCLLNGADVTIWPTVSVGIQQAAATGCLLLIPAGSTGEFLIEGDASILGSTFSRADPTSLAQALEASAQRRDQLSRSQRATTASRFYSDSAILAAITEQFLRQPAGHHRGTGDAECA